MSKINVFIIHSGNDHKHVKKEIEPFLYGGLSPDDDNCHARILTLESDNGSDDEQENETKKANSNEGQNSAGKKKSSGNGWKKDASKKIKLAQLIIVFIGEGAASEAKADTMGWEVKTALKYNKRLVAYNPDGNKIPKYLNGKDRFTQHDTLLAEKMELQDIKNCIDNYANGYYDIFSKKYKEMETEEKESHKDELLDQYKLFQKSSEDLVERRQKISSFYISVNSALVSLLGVVMSLVSSPAKLYIMLFMCITGIILDISWLNVLDSYGKLNSAKMKVITLLEQQLPVALYDSEWRVMSDKLNNKKYVSFTSNEKKDTSDFYSSIYCYVCPVLGNMLCPEPYTLNK